MRQLRVLLVNPTRPLDFCPLRRFLAVQSAQSRLSPRRRMARQALRYSGAPAPATREAIASIIPRIWGDTLGLPNDLLPFSKDWKSFESVFPSQRTEIARHQPFGGL